MVVWPKSSLVRGVMLVLAELANMGNEAGDGNGTFVPVHDSAFPDPIVWITLVTTG